jgi:hypothetical protein
MGKECERLQFLSEYRNFYYYFSEDMLERIMLPSVEQ